MMTTRNTMSRRDFLSLVPKGAVMASLPMALTQCAGRGGACRTAADVDGVLDVGSFAQFGLDDAMLRDLLAIAMGRGAEFADVYAQHRVNHWLGLEDGEVNRAYTDVELGVGIRAVKGDQTGYAFTEDLSVQALRQTAAAAAAALDGASSPGPRIIAPARRPDRYRLEVPWEAVKAEQKLPILETMEKRAFAVDPRIKKVRVQLLDQTGRILVADSSGRVVEDLQPMTACTIACVAEQNGRREDAFDRYGARRGVEAYHADRLAGMAETAAKRAVLLFEAAPPPAGELPVVLAPGESGILLHEAIGHGMEADFNRKRISIYADRIGQRIAPAEVTIVDDGTVTGDRGAINVDDEGRPGERTVLVEGGILRSYMHDRISAAHYRVEPTGNGRRESYQFPPVPRMRDTYMLAGPHDPEEIIRSVKKGLYAVVFTNGQVEIGAGDFSFYLKTGYLIEDGKITRPVKDANLIGNGPKVLEQAKMVGNDPRIDDGAWTCGKDGQGVPVSMGLPTVLVGGVSVGGVNA